MADLIINDNGDLAIQQITQAVADGSREIPAAFDLETTNDTLALLIRRAIQTPFGYLKEPALQEGNIDFIDANFGSRVYDELSEGINLNLLSRLKSHVINSLRVAGYLLNIADLQVGVVDTYTIQLYITYTDSTTPTSITLEI